MSAARLNNRLDRPVDEAYDHVLGPADAPITLVEYGSYACPYCRAANEQIAEVRDQLGDRLRYVFRHRPLTGSDIARRAAELAERADDPEQFWDAHVELMTRSETLTEDDLRAVAGDLDLAWRGRPRKPRRPPGAPRRGSRPTSSSARASGVMITPTFFINGRRYDGPWDESSLVRCDARHARPSRALGRARLRQLGPVRGRPAAAGDGARGGADQLAARAGLRRVLAAGLRLHARRCRASGCRCSIGSTTAC